MKGPPLAIREARPSDLALVYSAWINSLGRRRPFSALDRNWFSAATHALVTCLMDNPDVGATMACNPDRPDQAYGYSVHGPGRVLHWLYVRHKWRRASIGSQLMIDAFGGFDEPIEITVRTPAIAHLEQKWNLRYRSHALCEAGRARHVG